IGSDFCPRWYLFADGEDGSTPEPLQQGMVFSENVDRLTIRGCKLLAAGHSAIWLNKASEHCIVESNLIMGVGFAGVYANGWTLGKGPFKSAAESYVNKGHRIESNFIYDCGQFVAGGCGIQLYQSGDNLIARNEIGDMPRYGISCKGERYGGLPKKLYGVNVSFQSQFDFLHTRRNRIVGNEIYSVCRNSFDFGAIESWGVGRDNLWADNDLHDIDQTLDWDGWAHVLFADDACHYLTIRGNLIHHCNGGRATGAFMLKSIDELIEGNVVVDCRMGRIVTFEPYMEPSWDVAIRRNVFASDGVNSRYGDLNEYSFKGKGYLDVAVPPNSTGFQEVDHNFISPVDPAKRNPNAAHGMDLHSVFAPNLVTCMAASWDATRLDYRVKPLPGLKFDSRRMSQTGLRKDFPFDKSAATRRSASDKIQAEDYQRMNDLRTWGGLGVYAMQKGSWAKYANVDFGPGRHREAVFQLEPAKAGSASGPLVEIHIDSPRGRIIGRQDQGQTACPVSAVRGIHNVYLVFENSGMKSVDWFVFR
ncbi:MAG: right-handed parallel beta-helix repeat-containing protein, partial [Fimbriimonas sp.]|nr:right-handed parallel beta-helix repeat-containing protein [Fimbriimonas sp.]